MSNEEEWPGLHSTTAERGYSAADSIHSGVIHEPRESIFDRTHHAIPEREYIGLSRSRSLPARLQHCEIWKQGCRLSYDHAKQDTNISQLGIIWSSTQEPRIGQHCRSIPTVFAESQDWKTKASLNAADHQNASHSRGSICCPRSQDGDTLREPEFSFDLCTEDGFSDRGELNTPTLGPCRGTSDAPLPLQSEVGEPTSSHVLVCEGQSISHIPFDMCWYTPASDSTSLWQQQPQLPSNVQERRLQYAQEHRWIMPMGSPRNNRWVPCAQKQLQERQGHLQLSQRRLGQDQHPPSVQCQRWYSLHQEQNLKQLRLQQQEQQKQIRLLSCTLDRLSSKQEPPNSLLGDCLSASFEGCWLLLCSWLQAMKRECLSCN